MADPARGLGLASLHHPTPLPSTPSSPCKNMTNLVFIYLKRPEERAGKKLCKIDTKLVVPALLVHLLVGEAEEI